MAILTISREIGTEGLEIGKKVAEEMGYEFFDKERVLHELKTEGPRWEEVVDRLDSHVPSLWEKYDWHYMGYVALAESHILDCALSGKAVILGRGANFLLENVPYAFRVRVVAPIEARLKRATQDQSCNDFVCVNTNTSQRLLEKADRESENFIRSEFGKDWNNPMAYDMILNMGGIRLEEAVEALKIMLESKEKLRDAQAENQLKKRALAARVKAAILTNPVLSVPTLEVMDVGEEVVLKGVVHNARDHKLIEEEAKKIAGSVPVRCELHYRS
jgi:cytidylate kinase